MKHSRPLSRHTSVSVCVTHQLKTQTDIFFKIQDMSGPKAQTTGIFHFLMKDQKLIKSWIQIEETIVPVVFILSFSQPHSAVHLHIRLIPSPSTLPLFFSTPNPSLATWWGSAWPSSISVCQLARKQIPLHLCDRTKTAAPHHSTPPDTGRSGESQRHTDTLFSTPCCGR